MVKLNGHGFRLASYSPDAKLMAEYPTEAYMGTLFSEQPNCPSQRVNTMTNLYINP